MISPFIKSLAIFVGVATCDIIKISTVDLYLYYYSLGWFEVTQTAPPCVMMVIVSRNSDPIHYFDTKSLIWSKFLKTT